MCVFMYVCACACVRVHVCVQVCKCASMFILPALNNICFHLSANGDK